MSSLLLGGVSATEFMSLVAAPCFFIAVLMTPFFGVRRMKENAESYAHHLVLSGGLIASALAFVLVTDFSSLAFLILATPNAFWFVNALTAQQRAQQRKDQEP
ncbi:MAG: hypothetical protein AB8H86_09695 [Polyangiales bacterium]